MSFESPFLQSRLDSLPIPEKQDFPTVMKQYVDYCTKKNVSPALESSIVCFLDDVRSSRRMISLTTYAHAMRAYAQNVHGIDLSMNLAMDMYLKLLPF